jgi:hypothetical protein
MVKRRDDKATTPECRPLAQLLAELAAEYVLVEEWSSRTSRLSRFRSAARRPAELVVKVCERWKPEDAGTSFESARRLTGLAPDGRARVIEFVAWSAHPPALVSELVAGEELSALLRGAGDRDATDVGMLVTAAGELLGRAHRLPIPDGATMKRPGPPPRRAVLSVGDFAAYNFRLDDDGHVVYLEPPSKLRIVAAYRDLAWFLASVRALLQGRPRLVRQLRRYFVDGYRRGSRASWGPLDDIQLRLHVLRRRRGMALRVRRQAQREDRLREGPAV